MDWVEAAQQAVKPEGGPLPDEVQALALVAIATELRTISEALERMAPRPVVSLAPEARAAIHAEFHARGIPISDERLDEALDRAVETMNDGNRGIDGSGVGGVESSEPTA